LTAPPPLEQVDAVSPSISITTVGLRAAPASVGGRRATHKRHAWPELPRGGRGEPATIYNAL
jgi:hypothetical protein